MHANTSIETFAGKSVPLKERPSIKASKLYEHPTLLYNTLQKARK